MQNVAPGKVIVLNGASSAGKSTLGRALQARLDEPFLRFSPDLVLFSGEVLPPRRDGNAAFAWATMRPRVFDGYYACLAALARAGNNVVADLVLESNEQWRRLVRHLAALDVFFVGVHCALPELERRERARGDRRAGDARRDLEFVHSFSAYDAEVDSAEPPEVNADRVAAAWAARARPSVFDRAAAG